MAQFAFNVWEAGRLIDTVFYTVSIGTKAEAVETVRRSLISHDGYSDSIKVTWPKGQRITETVFVIQGNYGQGWEDENEEVTRKGARRSLKEYRENGAGAYRLVTKMQRK